MSWQSKVLELVKKYGEPARFAASTILRAVIPESAIVIGLVEQAFDSAQKTAQDDWELNLSKQVEITAENQARLEQMLAILGGDLQHLFVKVVALEGVPDLAQKLVEDAQESDELLREAVKKLDTVAHQFDHLKQLTAKVLERQSLANRKLNEISASMSRQSQLDRQQFFDAVQVALEGFDAALNRRTEQLFQHCSKRLPVADVENPDLADLERSFFQDVETNLFPPFHTELNAAILVNGQYAMRFEDIEKLKIHMCRSTELKLQLDQSGGLLSGLGAGAAVGAGIGSFVPVLGTALGAMVGGVIGAYSGKSMGKQQLVQRRIEEVRKHLDTYLSAAKVSRAKALAFVLEKCLRPLA